THRLRTCAARPHGGSTRALLRRGPIVRGVVRDSDTASTAGLEILLRLQRDHDAIEHIDHHAAGARHGTSPPRRRRHLAATSVRLSSCDGGPATPSSTGRVRASLWPGRAGRRAPIHRTRSTALFILALSATLRRTLSGGRTTASGKDTTGLPRTDV